MSTTTPIELFGAQDPKPDQTSSPEDASAKTNVFDRLLRQIRPLDEDLISNPLLIGGFADPDHEAKFEQYVFSGRPLITLLLLCVSMTSIFTLAFHGSNLSGTVATVLVLGSVFCATVTGVHLYAVARPESFAEEKVEDAAEASSTERNPKIARAVARIEEGALCFVCGVSILAMAGIAYPKQRACQARFPLEAANCTAYVDWYLLAVIEVFCVICPARFQFVLPLVASGLVMLGFSYFYSTDVISGEKHVYRMVVETALAAVNLTSCYFRERAQRTAFRQFLQANDKQQVSDFIQNCSTDLLYRLFPGHTVAMLGAGTKGPDAAAAVDESELASVFRSDLASFTAWSSTRSSVAVTTMLQHLTEFMDRQAALFGLTKVKTIGDAYWAFVGLVPETEDAFNEELKQRVAQQQEASTLPQGNYSTHQTTVSIPSTQERMVRFALSIRQFVTEQHNQEHSLNGMRIGVATGKLLGLLIGTRQVSYEVFGPADEAAQILEQKGKVNELHICHATSKALVASNFCYTLPSETHETALPAGYFPAYYARSHEEEVPDAAVSEIEYLAAGSENESDDLPSDDPPSPTLIHTHHERNQFSVSNELFDDSFASSSASPLGREKGTRSLSSAPEMSPTGLTGLDAVATSSVLTQLRDTLSLSQDIRRLRLRWVLFPRFSDLQEQAFVQWGLQAERLPYRGCGIALTITLIALSIALTVVRLAEAEGNIIGLWIVTGLSALFPAFSLIAPPKSRGVATMALLLYYGCGAAGILVVGLLSPAHFLSTSTMYLRFTFAVLKGSIITVPNTPGVFFDLIFPVGADLIVVLLRDSSTPFGEALLIEEIVWLVASFFVGWVCRMVGETSNRYNFLQKRRAEITTDLLQDTQSQVLQRVLLAVPSRFSSEILEWVVEKRRSEHVAAAVATVDGNNDTSSVQVSPSVLPLLPNPSARAAITHSYPLAAIGFFQYSPSANAITTTLAPGRSPGKRRSNGNLEMTLGATANDSSELIPTIRTTEDTAKATAATCGWLARVFQLAEGSLANHPEVLKIKTVGDSLLCAVLPEEGKWSQAAVDDAAFHLFAFAVDQLLMLQARPAVEVQFRAGIHVGPITGCVLGYDRLSYDILGDPVNTASRVCSTTALTPGGGNKVSVSAEAFSKLQERMAGKKVPVSVFLNKKKINGGPVITRDSLFAKISEAPENRKMKGKGEVSVYTMDTAGAVSL